VFHAKPFARAFTRSSQAASGEGVVVSCRPRNMNTGTFSSRIPEKLMCASCKNIVVIEKALPSSQATRSAAVYSGEIRPAWK
jgi:hypothetical protein